MRFAALGTAAVVALVALEIGSTSATMVDLLGPGDTGPSRALVLRDFPGAELRDGVGLDGQQYYAMARTLPDLDDSVPHLDRSRYRWQRPVFPALARALHPVGGGEGLLLALVAVGVAALLGGAVVAGHLSVRFGGPPHGALLVALSPGAYLGLRATLADTLALALALATIALLSNRRLLPAAATAVLAVLTKEAALLILIGWWVADRTRRSFAVAALGAVTVALWAGLMRLSLPPDREGLGELVAPLTGITRAVTDYWLAGEGRFAMVSVIAAVTLAVAGLVRHGRSHPLWGVVVVQLAFMTTMNEGVLGLDFGGTRSSMPLFVAAGIMALTPAAVSRPAVAGSIADAGSGREVGLVEGEQPGLARPADRRP